MNFGTRLLIVIAAIVSQTHGAIYYAGTLPPRPDQSTITCHDAAWEKANLTAVAGSFIQNRLAPYIERLIRDARSQGVNMGITVAYRSCAAQLQLRAQNCGPDAYSIYSKPAEACTPATEPAGQSLHQEGLAIDFSCDNYALFQNSPCFSWLKVNASHYYLQNRLSEAWHWSTTSF